LASFFIIILKQIRLMNRGVIVTLDNGALGRTQGTEDGIFGMVLYGSTNFVSLFPEAAFPAAIYSLKDLEAKGVTAQTDAAENCDIWQQVYDFYSFSGNSGRKLWITLIPDYAFYSNVFDMGYARKLIDAANGEISVLFVGGQRSLNHRNQMTFVNGLDSTVTPALAKAQTFAEECATRIMPIRIVMDGHGYDNNVQALTDLTTMTRNRLAINLASNLPNMRNAAQGLLAGRLAYIPVNESAGWVAPGGLPNDWGGYTSGLKLPSMGASPSLDTILDKGYISFQTYPRKFGYFFCDPRMATALSDDYAKLTDGRVIDKAHKLAYQTFVNYVNGQMYVNADGTLNAMQVRAMEADIENVIGQQMVAKGECSFVKCVIDPKQKVLQTNELKIGVKVIPTATLSLLSVKLGFAQSV
jgi:Protein of unknown function (DUF2586)